MYLNLRTPIKYTNNPKITLRKFISPKQPSIYPFRKFHQDETVPMKRQKIQNSEKEKRTRKKQLKLLWLPRLARSFP